MLVFLKGLNFHELKLKFFEEVQFLDLFRLISKTAKNQKCEQ